MEDTLEPGKRCYQSPFRERPGSSALGDSSCRWEGIEVLKIRDYFDRIWVINLPERRDRKRAMLRELERAGMPPAPNKVEIFPGIRSTEAAGFTNIGVRGCFLSHLAVLERARAEGLSNVLVMEDDLAISPRLVAEQEQLVEVLRTSPWGFVYFGHGLDLEETPPGPPVTLGPFDGPIVTAHFYGVNAAIFDPLVSFLRLLQDRPAGHPDGGPMHLDGAFSFFRERNPEVSTLVASPSLGRQRRSRSDLSARWFDRVPGLREIANVARSGMERVRRGGDG